jgi:hypothetical protein
MATADEKLEVAEGHLERVQEAWEEPDWADLSFYGFYGLEAAVEAAAIHLDLPTPKNHWGKVETARELHRNHAFPDIEQLLSDLNDARKAKAYGDDEAPDLDAEETASSIKQYVDAVRALIKAKDDSE